AIQVLTRQAVVGAVQGNAVIPDLTRQVNLLIQMSILFASVQFELVGLGHVCFALVASVLPWRVDPQWQSCSRLSPHRYAVVSLRCLSRHARYDISCTHYTRLCAYCQVCVMLECPALAGCGHSANG